MHLKFSAIRRDHVVAACFAFCLLFIPLFVETVFAESCDQTCSQATEAGINQTTDDAGATVDCCCVEQQGGPLVSRPVEECHFD